MSSLRPLVIALGLAAALGAGFAAATGAAGLRNTSTSTTTPSTTLPFEAVITKWVHSSAKRTATFWFVAKGGQAASFMCDLDRHGYVTKAFTCLSPKHYGKLQLGTYTFSVWALDASGAKSATASKDFTIN